MAAKTDVRSTLTEIFLKSIEEDPLSWHSNFKSPQRPMNGIYHNQYKGYNRMLLSYVMKRISGSTILSAKLYFWITRKQRKSMG